MLDAFAHVGEWFAFSVRAWLGLPGTLLHPSRWLRPLYGTLVGGLPLAAVTGLALGVVVWIHTRGVLARTGGGAVEYLPSFLAAAVLLELGPIAAGLIVAARTGASLGAELASLRIGEQIDALELLGVSPLRRLVAPRVVACILATPVLHILIAALAIGGGFVAELATGSTHLDLYQAAVWSELRLAEIIPAGLKTLVFGGLIGTTGCLIGLSARGGSEGVGQAATNSVVTCTLIVLIADVFLVGLIQVFVY